MARLLQSDHQEESSRQFISHFCWSQHNSLFTALPGKHHSAPVWWVWFWNTLASSSTVSGLKNDQSDTQKRLIHLSSAAATSTMGDSDDDGDYKRSRDKFRSERRGYDGGGGGGGGGDRGPDSSSGGRRDWSSSGGSGRHGPSSGGGSGAGWGGRDNRGDHRRGYDNGGGGGYGGRRDRYSPPSRGGRHDMSPPSKRMRPEW